MCVRAWPQITGGNPSFRYRLEGFNAITRLTFGYMDYDNFINHSIGVSDWKVRRPRRKPCQAGRQAGGAVALAPCMDAQTAYVCVCQAMPPSGGWPQRRSLPADAI